MLNDLTGVNQGGQMRTYAYDALGRVTSATAPESGTTRFYYTTSGGSLCSGDSNAVCRRTDARSITTTYAYDALNRLTSKTYNDTPRTPAANFFYDESLVTVGQKSINPNNYKGRLTHTSGANGTAMTGYSYDAVGRITDLYQCTPYNCSSSNIWDTQYNYDLAGDVASWVNPGGFTVTNSIGGDQRIAGISSSLSDSSHPATIATISYTPFGAFQSLQNGCVGTGCLQIQENYAYNNRLQPVEIQLGTSTFQNANYCLVYNYYVGVANATTCTNTPRQGTTGNDGNVTGYLYLDSANDPLSHSTTYTYDSLNRLTNSTASSLSQGGVSHNLTFNYDRYGNMTCVTNASTNGPCPNWTFNSATNRFSTSGFTYDAAGDLTTDASLMPNHTYQWDGEGHLISVDSGSSYVNTYNALGQQVEKVLPGYQNDFVYDTSGRQIGEYSPPNSRWDWRFIMLGDRVIANELGGETLFPHANLLHSTTVVTDYVGRTLGDQLFYPWGQQWANAGTQYELHFGGMFITDEGNYEALVRFHSPPQGRWLTPDPLAGDVTNPQSLNRYAYPGNNPTSFTDPLGLDAVAPDPFAPCNGGQDPAGYPCTTVDSGGGGGGFTIFLPVWPGDIGGGGGGGTSSGGSATGGNAFTKNPLPCIDPSVLEDAIVNGLNWLFMPTQPITKSQIVAETVQGGGNDFSFYDPTVKTDSGLIVNPTYWPEDIHRINKGLGKIFNHPQDYQIYTPQPADAVPGPGKILHVTFDQGPPDPNTGLPSIRKISAHFDLKSPLEGDPGNLVAHGLGDVFIAWVFSHAQGGCGVKFQ